mmetsp:Transcript_44200/g.94794  ORF Transcript_44200/g.94794 Transcript_44200/m.94794 type:complete len:341 (-) Transcript_44200:635-1657(-)
MARTILEVRNTFIFERELPQGPTPRLFRSKTFPICHLLESCTFDLEDRFIPTEPSIAMNLTEEDESLSNLCTPNRACTRLSSLSTAPSDHPTNNSSSNNTSSNNDNSNNNNNSSSNNNNMNMIKKNSSGSNSCSSVAATPNAAFQMLDVRSAAGTLRAPALLRLRTFDPVEDVGEAHQPILPGTLPTSLPTVPGTTLMLRNIPRCFHRDMLVDLLDQEGFSCDYDFLYFPYKFEIGSPEGYAFVNAVTEEAAARFAAHFANFKNWGVPYHKKCTIGWSYGAMGLDANIYRYRNSPVMHPNVPEHWKPLRRSNGVTIPFEPPTKDIKLPRKGTKLVPLRSA